VRNAPGKQRYASENTNATAIMIGEKGADLTREDARLN
jgi:hypothetical protein